jgi:protein-tyrosine phosphatase
MQRIIDLKGGRNFRDLGGYHAADGRHIRWGRVFRSGVMSYLTDGDHEQLKPFGIRTVCDFRAQREREREPIRWGAAPVDVLHWDYDARQVSLRAFLTSKDLSPEVSRATMAVLYRRLPMLFRIQYTALFDRLAAGDVPLIFNCSAGKDRTGLAAALLLLSLGVSKDEVIADYVLTNTAVDLEKELFTHARSSVGLGDDHDNLFQVSFEARQPLLQALPEYLHAAFGQIEADYGSVPNFVRDVLAVDAGKLERIRDNLLSA